MEIDNYQFSCEYRNKQLELYRTRMRKARLWVLIVFSYYLLRAGLVIYPKYSKFDTFTKVAVIIQTVISIFLVLAFIYSFKVKIDNFYWCLYIQAIQMCLSNFNGYDEDDTKNFEGLNMLSTVYSVIFSIFNTYLGSMLLESNRIKLPMTLMVLLTTMGSILYTNFIWYDMTYHTVVSLIIGIIYGIITVIAFKFISKGIEDENLNEAKLAFSQKDMFRRMFNGLQEGIILLSDSKINFMNELSNRVFSELS